MCRANAKCSLVSIILKENNARTCQLASPEKISADDDQQSAGDNIETATTTTTTTITTTSEPSANSFIADIKSAAHQAQNETGFIYEPTSGLYYDSRTGYYYNAVTIENALQNIIHSMN